MPLAPALRGQLIRAESDVVLVGDHGENEDIHSILLMTLSPYFHTVLEGDTTTTCVNNNNNGNNANDDRCLPKRGKPVRIYGADSEILKLIKEYAYEGKITGLTEENIEKVHKVADMYNIMGIINECQLFIRNTNTQEH